MDVWMIWATDKERSYHWLVAALDDDSVMENPDGWKQMVQEARDEHGADNVSVVVTPIDFDAVTASLGPTRVWSGTARTPEVSA